MALENAKLQGSIQRLNMQLLNQSQELQRYKEQERVVENQHNGLNSQLSGYRASNQTLAEEVRSLKEALESERKARKEEVSRKDGQLLWHQNEINNLRQEMKLQKSHVYATNAGFGGGGTVPALSNSESNITGIIRLSNKMGDASSGNAFNWQSGDASASTVGDSWLDKTNGRTQHLNTASPFANTNFTLRTTRPDQKLEPTYNLELLRCELTSKHKNDSKQVQEAMDWYSANTGSYSRYSTAAGDVTAGGGDGSAATRGSRKKQFWLPGQNYTFKAAPSEKNAYE
jgi:hypothetical protein